MNIKQAIRKEFDGAYGATRGLINLIKDSDLSWKPEQGKNWMTVGQLLKHISNSCGWCVQGFISNNWDMSAFAEVAESDGGLMPADKLPAVGSVQEALSLLKADEELAHRQLELADDATWDDHITAPWGISGSRFNQVMDSIKHLLGHKSQLFYYLKLMGHDVNTHHLWGMGDPADQK